VAALPQIVFGGAIGVNGEILTSSPLRSRRAISDARPIYRGIP
jgi:hypothetical protein